MAASDSAAQKSDTAGSILRHALTRLPPKPGEFGFAVVAEQGGFARYACTFYDCFDQVGMGIGKSAAMGHVIAHELGHLLLGGGHHSGAGIMKANWDQKQIELAAQGALAFDRAERSRILDNIRQRKLCRSVTSRLKQKQR